MTESTSATAKSILNPIQLSSPKWFKFLEINTADPTSPGSGTNFTASANLEYDQFLSQSSFVLSKNIVSLQNTANPLGMIRDSSGAYNSSSLFGTNTTPNQFCLMMGMAMQSNQKQNGVFEDILLEIVWHRSSSSQILRLGLQNFCLTPPASPSSALPAVWLPTILHETSGSNHLVTIVTAGVSNATGTISGSYSYFKANITLTNRDSSSFDLQTEILTLSDPPTDPDDYETWLEGGSSAFSSSSSTLDHTWLVPIINLDKYSSSPAQHLIALRGSTL